MQGPFRYLTNINDILRSAIASGTTVRVHDPLGRTVARIRTADRCEKFLSVNHDLVVSSVREKQFKSAAPVLDVWIHSFNGYRIYQEAYMNSFK